MSLGSSVAVLGDPVEGDADEAAQALVDVADDGQDGRLLRQVDVAVPLLENLEDLFAAAGLLGRLKQEVGPHRDGERVAREKGCRHLKSMA